MRKRPSPPKKMFPRPLIVSTSYFTVFSNATTFPVSTLITSPGASCFSTTSPSISRKTIPEPEMDSRMKPSPPNSPEVNFFVKVTSRFTESCAHLSGRSCRRFLPRRSEEPDQVQLTQMRSWHPEHPHGR